MTSILSSLVPSSTDGIRAASRAFIDRSQEGNFEALLSSFSASGVRQKTNISSIMNAVGLDNGVAAGGDPLLDFMGQILASIESSLGSIGSNETATPISPAAMYSDAVSSITYAESVLASGGPLPTFIAKVIAERHLNATQQQALWNIARENKDVVKTPYTVEKIAMELQQAGI